MFHNKNSRVKFGIRDTEEWICEALTDNNKNHMQTSTLLKGDREAPI